MSRAASASSSAAWSSLPALRLKGIYLALVTLGLAVLFPTLIEWHKLEWLTAGRPRHRQRRLQGHPELAAPRRAAQGRRRPGGVHVLAGRASPLVLSYLVCRGIVKSRVGRSLVAIRDNETAAAVMGVNLAAHEDARVRHLGGDVRPRRLAVRHRRQPGEPGPAQLHPHRQHHVRAVMVLGGAATLWGPIVGALVYVYLETTTREAGRRRCRQGHVGERHRLAVQLADRLAGLADPRHRAAGHDVRRPVRHRRAAAAAWPPTWCTSCRRPPGGASSVQPAGRPSPTSSSSQPIRSIQVRPTRARQSQGEIHDAVAPLASPHSSACAPSPARPSPPAPPTPPTAEPVGRLDGRHRATAPTPTAPTRRSRARSASARRCRCPAAPRPRRSPRSPRASRPTSTTPTRTSCCPATTIELDDRRRPVRPGAHAGRGQRAHRRRRRPVLRRSSAPPRTSPCATRSTRSASRSSTLLTGDPAWGDEAEDYPWTTGLLIAVRHRVAGLRRASIAGQLPRRQRSDCSTSTTSSATCTMDAFQDAADDAGLEIVDEQTIERRRRGAAAGAGRPPSPSRART